MLRGGSTAEQGAAAAAAAGSKSNADKAAIVFRII